MINYIAVAKVVRTKTDDQTLAIKHFQDFSLLESSLLPAIKNSMGG
jgi:hypothetical protein